MTLQEKIQKKAVGYGSLAPAFLEGAEYALANQWISVEDDLPCNHEELINPESPNITVSVLITWHDCSVFPFRMTKNIVGKWEWENGLSFDEVGHWMPIPKPPKE